MNGGEINCKDRWNGTPLDDAIRTGQGQIIDFLSARGGRIYEDGKLVSGPTLYSLSSAFCFLGWAHETTPDALFHIPSRRCACTRYPPVTAWLVSRNKKPSSRP